MKLTTKAEGLSKKLAQHAKVIQQKSSTFTSDAVLLSAEGTMLQLTSTDLTTYLVNAEPADSCGSWTGPGTLQVSEGHCLGFVW